MAAYQGTYYTKTFVFKDADTLVPLDISTWEFSAMLRDRNDTAELLELTTANGGWAVTDGPNGEVEMRITADQTAELPVAKLVFDVLRTEVTPGPVWLFAGRFSVKRPVTRDE
jgi:hypothetical protein